MPKAPSALKTEKKETAKRPAKKGVLTLSWAVQARSLLVTVAIFNAHMITCTVEAGEKKDKKPLTPYMAFMKEKLAEYKEKHPSASHKEAFSAVRLFCSFARSNPLRIMFPQSAAIWVHVLLLHLHHFVLCLPRCSLWPAPDYW
ncbi:uncharacterized protein EI90DRAFT_3071320 [Cantharellus anzutake]|uniref:uncharacterized protein n=1 Tax=Cantharellus anzutake TaxID=1750568 RepID=UPI001903C28F|nr:uncharacterized protein EI90DRAFT_3071320 [Cantharellus anzutake]KAF8326051.1 hypothetical protein EI90DRAFT_3071320 [Cantharellus anzutake]